MSYYAAAALALVVLGVKLSRPFKLASIPTVGCSTWLGSWWAALRYFTHSMDMIQEGYEKHKLAPFKVAELLRWTIIVSSREHVEELVSAPDDVLSLKAAIGELIQADYTLGAEVYNNPYQLSFVRSTLTRDIESVYPALTAEVTAAIDDALSVTTNEWKSVPGVGTMQKVVSRTINRLFVGIPLCRDPEWIDLTIQNTMNVIKAAAIIRMFPRPLKPFAARFLTGIRQSKQHVSHLLRPIVEERQRQIDQYGDEWPDKPNDLLSWLMGEAVGPERSVEALAARVLALDFAVIHTSSVVLTHTLFYLAAYPQYIQPLREEVDGIIGEEGLTKAAVDRMRKLDSFMKECQRLEGVGGLSLERKALKDFRFSDGTVVPKGTTVVAAARFIHLDEAHYKSPHAFEPFRFSDADSDSAEGARRRFVSTSPDYLLFGHGRHACLGRVFAAHMLKCVLAHIIVTYDVQLEDGKRPETVHFGASFLPHRTAKVMFRRRADQA